MGESGRGGERMREVERRRRLFRLLSAGLLGGEEWPEGARSVGTRRFASRRPTSVEKSPLPPRRHWPLRNHVRFIGQKEKGRCRARSTIVRRQKAAMKGRVLTLTESVVTSRVQMIDSDVACGTLLRNAEG